MLNLQIIEIEIGDEPQDTGIDKIFNMITKNSQLWKANP